MVEDLILILKAGTLLLICHVMEELLLYRPNAAGVGETACLIQVKLKPK